VRGASFAEVLDRLIDPWHAETTRRPWTDPSVTTAPICGTPFVHRWGYDEIPLASQPLLRPRRVLTAAMRTALDVLRSAGATDLHDDFLVVELKTAFRRLARRAHPDMHPHASEHEKPSLVARFRRIHEAYQLLASYSN
jgi:hypothetical protein